MTMRLTIKNEDSARSVRVFTRDLEVIAGYHTGACTPTPPVVLAPGEWGEFWIYANRDLLAEELQPDPVEATDPQTPP